ncbi:hypothetical protein HHX48_09835 [Salinimonas sp. HHU 13199]|uniref:Uncharacterized protein n=1 Tax=Salinimonas profundi TaxID=2729140 RepID=A0ABR8LII8_9ALTE|nr:hypothetical protein [Salinimonas profundi]MBD3586037.1 hypothetical protein [Salinimonas profundi]
MVKYFILSAALFVILLILNASYEKSDAPAPTSSSASLKLQPAPLPDPARPVLVASDTDADSNTDTPHTMETSSISADILAEFENFQQMNDEEVFELFMKLIQNGEDITTIIFQLIENGIVAVNVPLTEAGIETPMFIAMAFDSDMTPAQMQKFIDMGSYQTVERSIIAVMQLRNPDTAALLMTHLGYGPEHYEAVTVGAAYVANRALFDYMVEQTPGLLVSSEVQTEIESMLDNIDETVQIEDSIKKKFESRRGIDDTLLKERTAYLFERQIARRQMLLEMQTLSVEQRQRINDEINAFRQASEDRFSTLL